MTRSFYPCDREQLSILPPSILDWIPEGDLSRFVVDVVEEMDLKPFYAKYKDGSGQTAYRPEVMVSLLVLAYCEGVRSSRAIERLCTRDIRYRMVTCNEMPDHTTIARFRNSCRDQLHKIFVDVLRLCAEAGLVKLGLVAVDGTKIKANAAMEANRSRKELAELVEKMLIEAEQTDVSEDEQKGVGRRGDELPDNLQSAASRRAKLRAAKERLDRLDRAHKKADGKSRALIKKYDKTVEGRQTTQFETGKKPGGRTPRTPAEQELNKPKGNLTDPDSEAMSARSGFVQGFNAQAAVTSETQIIVAANVVGTGTDMNQLAPMLDKVRETLAASEISQCPCVVAADAGYWTPDAITLADESAERFTTPPELLVAVPHRWRKLKEAPVDDTPPGDASLHYRIEYRQRGPSGRALYRKRAQSVEPAFGQVKTVQRFDRFSMRGIENVQAEWLLVCATHNLLKLWRHKYSQN